MKKQFDHCWFSDWYSHHRPDYLLFPFYKLGQKPLNWLTYSQDSEEPTTNRIQIKTETFTSSFHGKILAFHKKKTKTESKKQKRKHGCEKAEGRVTSSPAGRKKPPDQEQLSKIISRSGASVSRSAPIDEMIEMWFFVWKLRREKKQENHWSTCFTVWFLHFWGC